MKTFLTLVCAACIVFMASFLTRHATIEDVVQSCHEQGWYLLKPVDDQLKNGAILFCKPMTSDEVQKLSEFLDGFLDSTFTARHAALVVAGEHVPDVCSTDPEDTLDLQECP